MERLLKRHFGYNQFRPLQLDIIESVLQKQDTFVLMPTGGGKSICYQLPALKLEGLTIVISPLISLMKDQVDSLNANGIPAEFINSSLSYKEIMEIQVRICMNDVKILYVAPERLASENFKVFLAELKISLIAIDEAHCISEWGHNFRPDYRNLKELRETFPETPLIALTATATKKVQDDIINQLSLKNPKIFVSSFNRKNLNLTVAEKKNTFTEILKLLKKYKNESAIIYCFSRKDAERIAGQLVGEGFSALPYHAGLDIEIRKRNQELFIQDKVDIIVATIAFGMGIDKSNVRLVVHHTFSKSLEGYYQEIGRAGRDGLPSECVLFYSRGDRRKHEYFLDQIEDDEIKYNTINKMNGITNYCESRKCRRKYILEYFGEFFHEDNCGSCDVCTKPLQEKETMNEIISLFSRKQKQETETLDYDKILFDKLKLLRKKFAEEKQVPPYIIFNDTALQEMAFYLPSTEEEFLNIKGVGQQKLSDYGHAFLSVINNYLRGNGINLEKVDVKNERKEKYAEQLQQIKMKYPNAYEPWSTEEDEKLKTLFSENEDIKKIGEILQRQPGAIKSRLRKYNLMP